MAGMADGVLMSEIMPPWVEPLGLHQDSFSSMPEGADALLWGFEKGVIGEEEYVNWASSFYKLPVLKPEFWAQLWEPSLIQQSMEIHPWEAHCFPIYRWEGLLFVACLKPQELKKENLKEKVCFVITPFSQLEKAWKASTPINERETQPQGDPLGGVDFSAVVEVDDDLTPIPQAEPPPERMEVVQAPQPPSPQTQAQEVTLQEMDQAQDPKVLKSIKELVAYMFGHLKSDYKKMMWLEVDSKGAFFPQYIFGDWSIMASAWETPIDLTHPNIFKVAFQSRLPFHGEIHGNPSNNAYWKGWTGGQQPSFASIFPLLVGEELMGFMACFEPAQGFDERGSLKKLENLVSLCQKSWPHPEVSKAA